MILQYSIPYLGKRVQKVLDLTVKISDIASNKLQKFGFTSEQVMKLKHASPTTFFDLYCFHVQLSHYDMMMMSF